ncbi:hypothetical protein SRHO_G00119170 [Serrasalmus rhombeus]
MATVTQGHPGATRGAPEATKKKYQQFPAGTLTKWFQGQISSLLPNWFSLMTKTKACFVSLQCFILHTDQTGIM